MFMCVVGNCLLFYCSCTGNCENCCGINGNESVSGSSISVSESESQINNDNNNIKDNKVDGNNILHKAFINGKNKVSVNVSRYIGNTKKDYNEAAKEEFLNRINNR